MTTTFDVNQYLKTSLSSATLLLNASTNQPPPTVEFSHDVLLGLPFKCHKQILDGYTSEIELGDKIQALFCRAMLCATVMKKRSQTVSDLKELTTLLRQEYATSHMLAFVYRTRALIAQNVDEGIEDCLLALGVYPDDSDAYVIMASLYQNKGDLHKSLESLSRAIECNPGKLSAYHARASMYVFDLNDPEKALHDYNKCVELDPNNGYMWRERGYLYENYLQQYDRALEDYTKAIEVSSADAPLVEFHESRYSLLKDKLNRPHEAQLELHKINSLR